MFIAGDAPQCRHDLVAHDSDPVSLMQVIKIRSAHCGPAEPRTDYGDIAAGCIRGPACIRSTRIRDGLDRFIIIIRDD